MTGPNQKSCLSDEFPIAFNFYGTKTICSNLGTIKYESCGENESVTGVEVVGFSETTISSLPENRKICMRTSDSKDDEALKPPLRYNPEND